jgi:Bacterial regulatory helix-turn-helix protein, lysR family
MGNKIKKSREEDHFALIEYLKVFVEAALRGSFAAVARDRASVGTAISQAISELEEEIGFQLIERGTRPLRLTKPGQRFLVHVVAQLEAVDGARGQAGVINVGPLKRFLGSGEGPPIAAALAVAAKWSPSPVSKTPPTVRSKAALPDGEFFVLIFDGEGTFSPAGNYDVDPKETEAIKTRRAAFYKALGPKWERAKLGRTCDLFHLEYPVPPAMGPEFVHKYSGFRRAKPKRGLDHYIQGGLDYATYGVEAISDMPYTLVSPEWKAAIESVEPDVHEFFEHEVIFTDERVPRYIFRDRQNVLFADPQETLFQPRLVEQPFRVIGKRKALAGRHWIRHGDCVWIFVSRELALELLPLLARTMRFVPITLKG